MRQVRIPSYLFILIVIMAVVAFGCTSPEATPTPAEATPTPVEATPTPVEATPTPAEDAGHIAEEEADHAHEEGEEAHEEVTLGEAALRGQEVFNTVGCVACHGQNAEGTAIAPGLPGHTEAQVRRQVRAPVGIMPVFPPDKITDSQLDGLVAYVTGLEGGHAHQSSAGVGAEMEMHHWMALFAVEDGDVDEGRHHVQHIIELTEGDHQARMQSVLTELEAGDLHDAAHTIEEMLAGVLANGLSGATMHLKMALSSTRIDDAEGAVHHMEHFIEVAEGAEQETGEAILALAQAGDLVEAEHELGELLGTLGVTVEEAEPAHEEETPTP